jgi:hypothetical protein
MPIPFAVLIFVLARGLFRLTIFPGPVGIVVLWLWRLVYPLHQPPSHLSLALTAIWNQRRALNPLEQYCYDLKVASRYATDFADYVIFKDRYWVAGVALLIILVATGGYVAVQYATNL